MIKDTGWSYAKQEDETVVRNNRGAGKVVRLCIVGVLLPLLLVTIPLYARFHLTRTVIYPFISSDQLLLDDHISTFWCQGQSITANGTFNAWLLGDTPKIEKHRRTLKMTEKMLMEEDMKEYWGFYLIKGSKIHLKYCARYPGSNVMIVRGAECLRICAFLQEEQKEGEDMVRNLLEDRRPNKRNSSSLSISTTGVNDSIPTTKIYRQPAINEISEAKTKRVLMEYKSILENYFQDLKQFKRITPTATRQKAKLMAKVLKQLSVPDGSKETHGGETTEDRNASYVDIGSEQVSSFSSSEENILTCPCQGVILYYPIIPSRHCNTNENAMFNDTSNSIEFVVDQDSHYYFLFTNDNELYDNPVAFDLDMAKIRYKVSHPIEVCSNVTACNFTLDFFSNEKVLFEQPFRHNFSKLNETYQLQSSCTPRTYVYLLFYIAIPIIIILVAFA